MSDSLPPYFPLVRKGCEKVAADLFQCLVDKTDPPGNTSAAATALQECKSFQVLYSQCTEASLSAKGAKQPNVLVQWEK